MASLPEDEKKLEPFFKELHRLGFMRTFKTRNAQSTCVIYELQNDIYLKFEVRLYADGVHSVAHWWGGYSVVSPTEFRQPYEVEDAIADQRSKSSITEKYARKHQPEDTFK